MSVEARLCKEIVEEEFGIFPSEVTYQLLIKGRMPLGEIVRFTNLNRRQVRESLTVLIQHGLCYFTEPITSLTARELTYYVIDATKILMRLRMGSILQLTNDTFGEEGQDIVNQIFLNGRMTLDGLKATLALDYDSK
ncbi:hypothetical protein DM01DRAFT_329174 [Hesseltinella vesiculosa]|uniref:DNA-directed RNA polymerase III subunit RPC3 n=1 Tax=Hesseltinella vesiculosa TaxID=101127 RepID=A0A1X2GBN2_9FUNG|nr:hypothetical protein DM01DRAFT_329174 [Hesseltinella vesiculosa]